MQKRCTPRNIGKTEPSPASSLPTQAGLVFTPDTPSILPLIEEAQRQIRRRRHRHHWRLARRLSLSGINSDLDNRAPVPSSKTPAAYAAVRRGLSDNGDEVGLLYADAMFLENRIAGKNAFQLMGPERKK